MPFSHSLNRADAISRYTELAHRFPDPLNPGDTTYVDNLDDVADEFDAFVLDGYGVLNVGNSTVPGAVERVAGLQQADKRVIVLTNGATLPVELAMQKYLNWGMQFDRQHVVSSRNALEVALQKHMADFVWGVAATDAAQIDRLAQQTLLLGDDAQDYDRVDGFIFLSSLDWTESRQALLKAALSNKKRPVLVGNPDLVAPHEHAMSLEPGFFTHALADEGLCEPVFYGKPFHNVFDLVAKQVDDLDPQRIAMVGDTLHTDILGGSSYGWRTILITDHGLMKGAQAETVFQQTGIRPHFVARTT